MQEESTREVEWTRGDLLAVSTAYWRGCTLQAAVRLGVFDRIGEGRRTAAEIAGELQTDRRGTEYLLNALAAMGLLRKSRSDYANSAAARDFLCKGSSGYLGHIILHHFYILDGWAQLEEVVKRGGPVAMRSYGEEAERESFLMGMFNLAMAIAPDIASRIDLSGRRRLLDLGGGPGTYAIHFCLHNPELSAVIFDRPTTRPFAEKTVGEFGVSDRVDFAGGDFHLDPVSGGPYDVAWLSQILHSSAPDECQRIIDKTVRVMEPGGMVMIHEFLLDDGKDGPEFPALFSLNMLIHNEKGRSYSEEEIRAMLARAGLKDIERLAFRGPNDSAIVKGIV